MWRELWTDFATRVAQLEQGGEARDGVDETILWQLRGHPVHVGKALAAPMLHLPEIYSGAPWRHTDTWVAFVAVNPSIDTDEIYPTLSHLLRSAGPESLVPFFEDRFLPETRDEPVLHGRDTADPARRPALWKPGRRSPLPRRSRTWTVLDNVLREALAMAGHADVLGLGVVGCVIDAVPWKFRSWGSITNTRLRRDLLEKAARYVTWMLDSHHPRMLVTLGVDAWHALAIRFPEVQHRATGASLLRRSSFTRSNGETAVVVGVHHPTRQGFTSSRPELVRLIAEVFHSRRLTVERSAPASSSAPAKDGALEL